MSLIELDPIDDISGFYRNKLPTVALSNEVLTVTATSTSTRQGIKINRTLTLPHKSVYRFHVTGVASTGT